MHKNSIEYPILKHQPSDFVVVENLVLPRHSTHSNTIFNYFRLLKSSFTTFESIEKVSQYFDIEQGKISYAGLKDEDAITEQFISISSSVKITNSQLTDFNQKNSFASFKFIELSFCGHGSEQISIGRLNGNSFRVVVRGLSEKFSKKIKLFDRNVFYFLNYYDTQRFGVPDGPKFAHLIGKAILDGNQELAFEYLKKSKSKEGCQALAFEGSGQDFFKNIDHRKVNFFKSSYGSHIWNRDLADLVRDICKNKSYETKFDTLPFVFVDNPNLLLNILNAQNHIPYIRYYDEENIGFRPTVIQVQAICSEIDKDERHDGKYKCSLSFFLPSGCYATMCIKQIVNQF